VHAVVSAIHKFDGQKYSYETVSSAPMQCKYAGLTKRRG
jgi:hypothetical protein